MSFVTNEDDDPACNCFAAESRSRGIWNLRSVKLTGNAHAADLTGFRALSMDYDRETRMEPRTRAVDSRLRM